MSYGFGCDGYGNTPQTMKSGGRISRRAVLQTGIGATLAAWVGRSALREAAFAAEGEHVRDVLVTLFLRGGMDGLSLVVPHGEDAYYRLRPTLSVARPGNKTVADDFRALDLDGFFGLHPALSPLFPFYREGTCAAVHAVGSGDATRSHFEAMATMERGLPDEKSTMANGWLARHLAHAQTPDPSPLRAVAWSAMVPDILRGATEASALQSLTDFRLQVPDPFGASNMEETLAALYKPGDDPLVRAGRSTLFALDALRRVDPAHYKPENGASYPESGLGDGLRQVACLLKARVGLEVACLDRTGWDTHVGQGTVNGFLAMQFRDVAQSLAAFLTDLGAKNRERVTILVMTEFGRRAGENSGLGTDHGRASSWLLLGGGVAGGKVYGKWPGLEPSQLEEPGDLRVTTDYRTVLAEVMSKRLGAASAVPSVFPGVGSAAFLGAFRPG